MKRHTNNNDPTTKTPFHILQRSFPSSLWSQPPIPPSPIEIFRFPIQYRRFYQKQQQQRRKRRRKKIYNIIFSHSCPASRKHTQTHTHTLIRNRVLPAIYNITHTYIICLHILFCFNFFSNLFWWLCFRPWPYFEIIYIQSSQVLYEYW